MVSENEDAFDMELFIEEVRQLPCIWDYTSSAYSSRIDKAKAWEYLGSKFYDNFNTKDQKYRNERVLRLQRKWRSLRDSYNREIKRSFTNQSGPGVSKHRQYVYFNNLNFLKPIVDGRTAENIWNENHQFEQDQSILPTPSSETPKGIKKKISKNSLQEMESTSKNASCVSTDRLRKAYIPADHTDSDLHFLLSLYDRFKAIDKNLKLQAQIEILNVIQKYNTPGSNIYNYEAVSNGLEEQYHHRCINNTGSYGGNKTSMSYHTEYPIKVEPAELQVSPTAHPKDIFLKNIPSVTSTQSTSAQGASEDSMMSSCL